MHIRGANTDHHMVGTDSSSCSCCKEGEVDSNYDTSIMEGGHNK
jgi:hypothetical protein